MSLDPDKAPVTCCTLNLLNFEDSHISHCNCLVLNTDKEKTVFVVNLYFASDHNTVSGDAKTGEVQPNSLD